MPNRLAASRSLYLRKHADNPIDWWPWCEQALETARRDNKPIFLSVGYSSCHWCTVMEGEAFSDPAIAAYMNANFLPIKVDREERPDLDSIYMQAVQMMIGQGGWPLNVFLTPDDLVPFYGGTYFPVEPRYGRPGFLQVLQAIRNYYDTQPEKLQSVKDEIMGNMRTAAGLSAQQALTEELLLKGLETSTGIMAGASQGPSFPMIPYADVALRATRLPFESRYNAIETSTKRGLDLALGGIFDHVAGGFHRYTVDSTWTVPHFEKMLYDNGQIMEYLANLWAAGVQEPAFERAIDHTVQWLCREMRAPAGYFYAAQDADSFITPADSEPEEGAFYVWKYDQLQSVLSAEELAELTEQFTVKPSGNFEGQIVLQRQHPGELSPLAELALQQLFALRYGSTPEQTPTFAPAHNNQDAKQANWPGRIPPVTDTKMIVAWNSLMISGLARAAIVWQRPPYLVLATDAANFILQHQWVNDRLHRVNYDGVAEILGQSEDYALFIKALLDLYQAQLVISTPSDVNAETWLQQALRVQAEFDQHLWSQSAAGYYNTDTRSDLLLRERSYVDSAVPSANGVATANLVRLALLTDELSYLDRAEQTLQAFSSVMARSPQACPSLFAGLDWLHHQTLVRTQPATLPHMATGYYPTLTWKLEQNLPPDRIALVCQGIRCLEPAANLEQMKAQILSNLSPEKPAE